jgi:hypothetical protein
MLVQTIDATKSVFAPRKLLIQKAKGALASAALVVLAFLLTGCCEGASKTDQ